MSKVAKVTKSLKRTIQKVNHGNKLRTNIPAGMATPGPPLGPMLGQIGLNIASFCKDFNEKTKDIKEGIPLPTRVRVNPDHTYNIVIHKPPCTYYLKQAAGIQRGAMEPGREVCGKITFKHLYEIAKIKSEDPVNEIRSLEKLCKYIIMTAQSCGIEIVKDMSPEEYQLFLEERNQIVEKQKEELKEKREAKMTRSA